MGANVYRTHGSVTTNPNSGETALVNRVFTGVCAMLRNGGATKRSFFIFIAPGISVQAACAKGARSVAHTRLLASVPGDNAMFILRSTSTPVRHAWEPRGNQT